MAFSVDLQYTINEDFSGLQTVTESGQPSSMSLQGLQSSQTYYTKAILKDDGVVQDESEIGSFQTLMAGTITLTHFQTVRSGYAYDVTYTYASTYAPSWATLSTNGSTFQGVINSGNNTVSFHVTGLTAGTSYITSVTMGDIYGETGSVQGSIVATVVNEITITNIDSDFTSVGVNLEYVIDGGFYEGYVEYWLSTQDPSTDPAEGHVYFNDGAETVTVSNLTEGTAYKFRATIILADGTTRIDSNVVAASTKVNYANMYFTIKNTSGKFNAISLKKSVESVTGNVQISTDGGKTWTTKTISGNGVLLATLQNGESVMVKHTGAMCTCNSNTAYEPWWMKIASTGNVVIYGNIASLTHGDNFTQNGLTMPDYAFYNLFGIGGIIPKEFLKVEDAEHLIFSSYTNSANYGCSRLFYGCSTLTTPPSLPMTSLGNYCYAGMFFKCTSLETTPRLPATTLAPGCYKDMFNNCASLKSTPLLPSTTLENFCYGQMFQSCSNLKFAPRLDGVTSIGRSSLSFMFDHCPYIDEIYTPNVSKWNPENSESWLRGVAESGTLHKPAELEIPTDNDSGVPTGWTTEDY